MRTKKFIASPEKLAAAKERGAWAPVHNYKISSNREYLQHGRWVFMDNDHRHTLEKTFYYDNKLYGQHLYYETGNYEKLMKCYTIK